VAAKRVFRHIFSPKKLLPKPLMWIGVNSYIRWKELGAGKEK